MTRAAARCTGRGCGACLGATTMGLHHKLCHVLGGTLDLPHAETHAVVLPHVPAFNAPAVPGALAALRRALDVPDPVRELHELGERLGIPRSLADLGLTAADVDRAVDVALGAPYANPRPASADDLPSCTRPGRASRRTAADPSYREISAYGTPLARRATRRASSANAGAAGE